MCLVCKRDSKNLNNFIDTAFQFHIMLNYCHEAISNYGTIDLDAYSILGRSPELLYPEMLFDPFEEQFDAPTVSVEEGNQLGRSFKIVGQKYVSGTIFGVNNNDFTEFLGIALRTFIPGEGADNIRHYALGKPSFPCPRLHPHIGFRPYDEERLDAVNGVEVGEIVVAPVENVMRTRLVRYLRHSFGIMQICRCNMHECRHFRLYIIESVHLDSSFVLAKLRPLKH